MLRNNFISRSFYIGFTLLTLVILNGCEAQISKEQVIKDVTFLAKDELNGRANFSTEIEVAADYINTRFTEIGLTHIEGLQDFKQTFSIIKIKPETISVTLNNKVIDTKNIAMASTIETISWNNMDDFNSHHISATDDLRSVLGKLNMEGGKHLVLLNSNYAGLFARYKAKYNRGLTKLNHDHQGAIIIVVTDEETINSIQVEATTSISQQTLTNLVGIIPGKSKADEVVLFSAHYDHLGEKVNSKGDRIFNGADDDASGTAAVINLAEYFIQRGDNERTLMFSTFAAEEIGGYGSKYFSKQLDPDTVTAMINIEMIGKPSTYGEGTVWMTGMERTNLGELLNLHLVEQKKKIYQDPYPEQKLFYRSDNATLARLGVPAHSFSTTQLDKDQHYHQVSDDIDTIDFNSLYETITIISVATQGLSLGVDSPTRMDASKVKSKGKIY